MHFSHTDHAVLQPAHPSLDQLDSSFDPPAPHPHNVLFSATGVRERDGCAVLFGVVGVDGERCDEKKKKEKGKGDARARIRTRKGVDGSLSKEKEKGCGGVEVGVRDRS